MDEAFSFQPSGIKSETYFDKIVVFNSIHVFPDLISALLRFVDALTDRGRLLIIHRPIRLNTLPLPTDILDTLRRADLSLECLISAIESLGLGLQWEVEDTRVVTPRRKWLDMIQHGRFPLREQDEETQASNSPAKTSSITQSNGVHQLMTGVLRYAGDSDIEFVDRMVFLTVNRASPAITTHDPATVTRQHKGTSSFVYGPLHMEVTPEIRALLKAKEQSQHKKWSLFD